MKKTNSMIRKRIMQRVPEEVCAVVAATLDYKPSLIYDLDHIVQAHSCDKKRSDELLDHIAALVASEFPGAERQYLRNQAFKLDAIDSGSWKKFEHVTIERIERKKYGWDVYWDVSPDTGASGTLLPFAADGYDPQVGDTLILQTIHSTNILGIVVNEHVFRYKTLEQENIERQALGWKPYT